jgi:hypothetical protein
VGDLELLIPKLRAGSFLPSILEPRRRVDQALHAVIMEAYIGGVSTRKVDALVSALGSQSGISKSQVSRICQEIDEQVQAFLSLPLQEAGHAPAPLRHQREPAALHRRAHAHEPRLPTPDAHGAPGTPQPGPRVGRCPPDPGGGRDPDRLLDLTRQAYCGQSSNR